MQKFKIISGGQTGADRAALDWAITNGYEHGGYCPRGRRSETGPIPPQYKLVELGSTNYLERTRRNVFESDATVIFSVNRALSSGSLFTRDCAQELGRPCVHISKNLHGNSAAHRLVSFLNEHGFKIRTLNIAGTRASKEPQVHNFVVAVLDAALLQTQLV